MLAYSRGRQVSTRKATRQIVVSFSPLVRRERCTLTQRPCSRWAASKALGMSAFFGSKKTDLASLYNTYLSRQGHRMRATFLRNRKHSAHYCYDSLVADFPNCCIVLAWDEGEQESWFELIASELGLWLTAACLSFPLAPLRLTQAIRQGAPSPDGIGVRGWLSTTHRIYATTGFASLWTGSGLGFFLDVLHAFPLLLDSCAATVLSQSIGVSYMTANVGLGILSTLSLPLCLALRRIQAAVPFNGSLYERIFALPARAQLPGIINASVPLLLFDAICAIAKRPADAYISSWLDHNGQGFWVNIGSLFAVRLVFLPLRVVYTRLLLGDLDGAQSWTIIGPFKAVVERDGVQALFQGAVEDLVYTAVQTIFWPYLYFAFTNSYHLLRKKHGRRQGAVILLKYEVMFLGVAAAGLYWQHRRTYPR